MSHYFESGMSVRETPWHGLGMVADRYPADWAEARTWAGLDWDPITVPVFGYSGLTAEGTVVYEPPTADTVQVLNPANTVELIKKHLGDQQDVLIATDERPVMDALDQLDDATLKRIGCKRVPGTDAPFAKLAETDLDKVVAALMKAAIAKAEAEA